MEDSYAEKTSESVGIQPVVRASSVYLTLQALLQVQRPESEAGWQEFASARNIAWKTGTSFGFAMAGLWE
jgi:penicillin-binding protein 1C